MFESRRAYQRNSASSLYLAFFFLPRRFTIARLDSGYSSRDDATRRSEGLVSVVRRTVGLTLYPETALTQDPETKSAQVQLLPTFSNLASEQLAESN